MMASSCGCVSVGRLSTQQLDWNPPMLSATGCPDLKGDYIYEITYYSDGGFSTNLIPIYSGSPDELWRTAAFSPTTGLSQPPNAKDLPRYQSYYIDTKRNKFAEGSTRTQTQRKAHGVLHIEQTGSQLIQGKSGETQLITNLGTEMAGCHKGRLILRQAKVSGAGDFVPRTISYGELEIEKTSNGSLAITQRRREKNVSILNVVTPGHKEHLPSTRIYPALGRRGTSE
ncbi:hypothetical protein [Variovorax sp. TBS-050B]|uniref:hypothetical protein n=1 Tax=Variovorax sp. TBS-050B TaxID=2940551 RepID=UPI00247417FC|nr:hypothetical protein [Variovorax sp. TBS-050B]